MVRHAQRRLDSTGTGTRGPGQGAGKAQARAEVWFGYAQERHHRGEAGSPVQSNNITSHHIPSHTITVVKDSVSLGHGQGQGWDIE